MLNFILCFFMFLSTDDFVSFDQGWNKHKEDRSPVVVIISSDSCAFCGKMKKTLLEVKKDFPDIVLSEIKYEDAVKRFSFIKDRRVPQTFMYAYDKELEKTVSFPLIIGSTTKDNIYKIWEMK